MRRFLLAICLLAVIACTTPPQPPKTPAQTLVEARAPCQKLQSSLSAGYSNVVTADLGGHLSNPG